VAVGIVVDWPADGVVVLVDGVEAVVDIVELVGIAVNRNKPMKVKGAEEHAVFDAYLPDSVDSVEAVRPVPLFERTHHR
jgi:hypothetical protein